MSLSPARAPSIVIRVDASARIGAGHLQRCAVLGRRLSAAGVPVHFLVNAEGMEMAGRVVDFAAACKPLDPALHGEADAARIVDYCRSAGADRIVVDRYGIDEPYQRVLLEAGLRWLQFDGDAQVPLWADWVVSMSPAADAERYRTLQRRPHTRMLIGPRYAIVRDEFLQWRTSRPTAAKARRLLLTFGGGDDRGACLACLEALRDEEALVIDILTSRYNPQVKTIQSWLAQHGRFPGTLRLDDPRFAQRMAEAEIAITAGGTTTFEAAMLGVPMLVMAIARNQRANAQAWERDGVAVDLGPLETLRAETLRGQLRDLASDPRRRETMSRRGRDCVDGHGSERLAGELCAA